MHLSWPATFEEVLIRLNYWTGNKTGFWREIHAYTNKINIKLYKNNNLYSYSTILYQWTAFLQKIAVHLNAAFLMSAWNTWFIWKKSCSLLLQPTQMWTAVIPTYSSQPGPQIEHLYLPGINKTRNPLNPWKKSLEEQVCLGRWGKQNL